jgi:hypothetical protein
LLGDIPILGWLFKSRNWKNDRKNLLLIITPYVIRTDEDYKKIVDRKLKEREEFSQMYYGGKIKTYNKFIDYDKKAGPLSTMLLEVNTEMNKTENGGPGNASDTIIKPKESESMPAKESGSMFFDPPPGASNQTVQLGEKPPFSENDIVLDEFEVVPPAPDVVEPRPETVP